MKKTYTKFIIITFILFSACTPILCSEQSWTLKKTDKPKKWLQSTCDNYAQKMVGRHSYKHNSFEHMRDMTILSVLPASISQAVLQQQRSNMKNFLIKNEENALEDVRQYWGFDQEEWSAIQKKTKEEIEFNLSEMKKNQNFNTYHDPSLPLKFITAIKHECEQNNININSLNLGITTTSVAHAKSKRPFENIYNPAEICFNINEIDLVDKKAKEHAISHELRHVIAGHCEIYNNITASSWDPLYNLLHQSSQMLAEINELNDQLYSVNIFTRLNPFSSVDINKIEQKIKTLHQDKKIIREKIKIYDIRINKLMDNFPNSPAYNSLIAAQEKTADTFAACTNHKSAKNAAVAKQITGYVANHNDMFVINTNWETSQIINDSRNMLQSIKNKIRQATTINRF